MSIKERSTQRWIVGIILSLFAILYIGLLFLPKFNSELATEIPIQPNTKIEPTKPKIEHKKLPIYDRILGVWENNNTQQIITITQLKMTYTFSRQSETTFSILPLTLFNTYSGKIAIYPTDTKAWRVKKNHYIIKFDENDNLFIGEESYHLVEARYLSISNTLGISLYETAWRQAAFAGIKELVWGENLAPTTTMEDGTTCSDNIEALKELFDIKDDEIPARKLENIHIQHKFDYETPQKPTEDVF